MLQHGKRQVSFCFKHKKSEHIFLNQKSARVLNNIKTSKRNLSDSLVLTTPFKSQLCCSVFFVFITKSI